MLTAVARRMLSTGRSLSTIAVVNFPFILLFLETWHVSGQGISMAAAF